MKILSAALSKSKSLSASVDVESITVDPGSDSFFYARVIGGDDFIASLWNVHLKVKEEGYVQVRFQNPYGPPRASLITCSPYHLASSGRTIWSTKRTKEHGIRRVLRKLNKSSSTPSPRRLVVCLRSRLHSTGGIPCRQMLGSLLTVFQIPRFYRISLAKGCRGAWSVRPPRK